MLLCLSGTIHAFLLGKTVVLVFVCIQVSEMIFRILNLVKTCIIWSGEVWFGSVFSNPATLKTGKKFFLWERSFFFEREVLSTIQHYSKRRHKLVLELYRSGRLTMISPWEKLSKCLTCKQVEIVQSVLWFWQKLFNNKSHSFTEVQYNTILCHFGIWHLTSTVSLT